MSKQLTSIISLRLEELGMVNLDIDIKNYIPNYKPATNMTIKCQGNSTIVYKNITYTCINNFAYIPLPPGDNVITIRKLLAHSGGIMDYVNGNTNPVPSNQYLNDP